MTLLVWLFLLLSQSSSAQAAEDCVDLYASACEQASASTLRDGTRPFPASEIQELWTQIKVSAQAVLGKRKLSLNIDQVGLQVADCLGDPTLANANYSPAKKTVTYCSGSFLSTTSLFQQIAVLAHELGHSLEPCSANFDNYVFKKVETCLRKDTSVFAQVWGFTDVAQFQTKCTSLSSACEKGISPACQSYERIGCEKNEPRCLQDQINESFADWFGTEVLADMITNGKLFSGLSDRDFVNGFKNIVRDTCGSSYAMDSTYPQPRDRFNKILLAHPLVREKLNCSKNASKPLYCRAH